MRGFNASILTSVNARKPSIDSRALCSPLLALCSGLYWQSSVDEIEERDVFRRQAISQLPRRKMVYKSKSFLELGRCVRLRRGRFPDNINPNRANMLWIYISPYIRSCNIV